MKIKNLSITRIIISVFTAIVSLLFIIPICVGIFSIGNIIGIIICLFIIFCLLYYHNIKSKIHMLAKNRLAKILMIIIACIICFALLCTIILSYFMIKAVNNPPPDNSTVIVLGCKVNGENPSTMLKKRLETALDYLNTHIEAVCIVSGGQGRGEDISEAQAMKEYLIKNGILTSRIYMEDKSHNTSQNIEFSKKIIEENNLSSDIAVVTDGFHELRASIIAKEYNLKAYSVPANTPWYAFLTYYIRELLALMEQIVLK